MHRLVASTLLVVILAGIFAPAAFALSPEQAHACCLRKASHCHEAAPGDPALSSHTCPQHSCRRSLAVRQWSQPTLPLSLVEGDTRSSAAPITDSPAQKFGIVEAHSGRAPPASSVS